MTAEFSKNRSAPKASCVPGLGHVKAALASAGHRVHDGNNRDFLVVHARWGQSRYCMDAEVLIQFGRIVGVLT